LKKKREGEMLAESCSSVLIGLPQSDPSQEEERRESW
jgi:hypothetical protein